MLAASAVNRAITSGDELDTRTNPVGDVLPSPRMTPNRYGGIGRTASGFSVGSHSGTNMDSLEFLLNFARI